MQFRLSEECDPVLQNSLRAALENMRQGKQLQHDVHTVKVQTDSLLKVKDVPEQIHSQIP